MGNHSTWSVRLQDIPKDGVAAPPFDNPDKADLIIRSSDGIDFYVYKFLLALVSPVFEDMFHIAIPQTRNPDEDLPYIDVTESSTTLRDLLSFIDPRLGEAAISFWQDGVRRTYDVACAADKYQMDRIQKVSAFQLRWASTSIEAEKFMIIAPMAPFREWAANEAKGAAVLALKSSFSQLDELKSTYGDSEDLRRLKHFHTLVSEQAQQYFPRISTTGEGALAWTASFPMECDDSCPRPQGTSGKAHWLTQYVLLVGGLVDRQPLGKFLTDEREYPTLLRAAESQILPCMLQGLKDHSQDIRSCNRHLASLIEDIARHVSPFQSAHTQALTRCRKLT
jgi:hypothetical protein